MSCGAQRGRFYQLARERLEVLDDSGRQILVSVTSTDTATTQLEQPLENPDAAVSVVNQNPALTANTEPTPTPAIVEAPPSPTPATQQTSSPTLVLPPSFKPYVGTTAGVSLSIPEKYVTRSVDPGQWAILQSYPEHRYVGGEIHASLSLSFVIDATYTTEIKGNPSPYSRRSKPSKAA